ncbi:hypothetical protein [Streptomyces globisporus]|uniref:hypothetical protein n=1 Tax=Streptomyces globisporus TaxID=1908 RepID=UPI0036C03E93
MNEMVWLETRVELDSLSLSMCDMNRDVLFEFVKALDERVAEWDFTVKLRDYFNGMNYPEEV